MFEVRTISTPIMAMMRVDDRQPPAVQADQRMKLYGDAASADTATYTGVFSKSAIMLVLAIASAYAFAVWLIQEGFTYLSIA